MTQETFVELYLIKYGNVDLVTAEKLVNEYRLRFPKKGITGICGYIKYRQEHPIPVVKIINYIMFEMQNAGLNNTRTSTESYWVEMFNDKMPIL